MADFGSMFDQAQADAEKAAAAKRDAAKAEAKAKEDALSVALKPLRDVAIPVLHQAQEQLKPKNVEVLIDNVHPVSFDKERRRLNVHFQLRMNRSFNGNIFVCGLDEHNVHLMELPPNAQGIAGGQKIKVVSRTDFQASDVEQLVSRAIAQIVNKSR